jgi:hypothetical protein
MENAKKLTPFALAIIAALIFSYPLFLTQWDKISSFQLPDNDDQMRLFQVQNWLLGQDYFDTFNHRVNIPNGVSIHWSRLVDFPIAFLILIFRPFFGEQNAQNITLFFLPIFYGAFFVYILSKIVKLIGAKSNPFLIAGLFVLYSASASLSFVPGRIDHHNLQLICMALALYGIIKFDAKGGIFFGIAAATSLTIGLETLPFIMILISFCVLNWILDPIFAKQFVAKFALTFGIALFAGFLIDVAPKNYLIGANDYLSIAQLIPLLIGAIGLGIINYNGALKLQYRILQTMFVGFAIVICALGFKELRLGLYYQVDSLVYKIWFAKIPEVLPLINLPLMSQLSFLIYAIIGLLSAFFIAWENRKSNQYIARFALLLAFLLLLGTIATMFWQNRLHPQISMIAILTITYVTISKISPAGIRILSLALLVLFPITQGQKLKNSQQLTQQSNTSFNDNKNCKSKQDFQGLSNLPKGNVLNNIDIGVKLLAFTPHNIISAPYHRDTGAPIAYSILLANPEKARESLAAKNINYIAICRRDIEVIRLVTHSDSSLIALIMNENLPNYLAKIPNSANSDILSYKIIQ